MMNKFNDIIEQISKEDIIQYYIEENHSFVESAEHFGVKGGMFARLIKYYAIKKSKEKHSERIAITKLERYGSATYNNRDKAKVTCIEKFGVDNPFKNAELMRESYQRSLGVSHPMKCKSVAQKVQDHRNNAEICAKSRHTYEERTGYSNPAKDPKVIQKGIDTKHRRGTFKNAGSSMIEDRLGDILRSMYSNVLEQYQDARYARENGYKFRCDYYLPDEDVFIELNASYYHDNHPFDSTSSEDVEAADLLKNSQKKWEREKYDTWCVRDTEKQLIAVKNNLKYLQIYPENTLEQNKCFNPSCLHDLLTSIFISLKNHY